ncbi:hypothetical protein Afe04nite_50890 [Asanoa ferruginea]|nr:hypothetical protein Afe04nite_50890 [Asanoa ferruginea]
MPGGNQHQGYAGQPSRTGSDQLGDRVLDRWWREFDEAARDGGVERPADPGDEAAEVVGALRVGGAVSGDEQRDHASGSP